jgi:hypothetical protein
MTRLQAICVLGFAVALAVTSCKRVEKTSGDTVADDASAKHETQDPWLPYQIASHVLKGCRGPADPGCEACARPASPNSCLICHQWGPAETDEYSCRVWDGECPVELPQCARCSRYYERDLAAVLPLIRTSDDPPDVLEAAVEICRDSVGPTCPRARWAAAAAHCPPEMLGSGRGTSMQPNGSSEEPLGLPYTIEPVSLEGCRSDKEPNCHFCVHVYEGSVKAPKVWNGSTATPRPMGNSNGPLCAQCEAEDQDNLRRSSPLIADCACDLEAIWAGDLIDVNMTPGSCAYYCYWWLRATLRCPPADLKAAH